MKHTLKESGGKLSRLFPTHNLAKIEDCQRLTVRATTMVQVWDSKEPTFNAIRRELGSKNLKGLLIIEVGMLVVMIKADMDAMQIEHFADYIITHYPSYTISDLTCFKNFFLASKSGKSWGKPTLQNLINELNSYSSDRDEYAVGQRQKEHLESDEILRQNKQILGTYAKMKAKANEPVVTQKEKDAKNRIANDKRIEELKKIYPTKK